MSCKFPSGDHLPHTSARHPGRRWRSASLRSSLPQQALRTSRWTFQVMPVQLKCYYWYICSLYFGAIDLFKTELFWEIRISPFFFSFFLKKKIKASNFDLVNIASVTFSWRLEVVLLERLFISISNHVPCMKIVQLLDAQ